VRNGLVSALLLERNDEWAASRACYMSLETLAGLGDTPPVSAKAIPAT
jgi:hypothetical protein